MTFFSSYLEQTPELQLPVLSGRLACYGIGQKEATSGGLDGWGWNELEAPPLSWFVCLAWILRLVEDAWRWPDGLLDAYVTLIPKADGDSTP